MSKELLISQSLLKDYEDYLFGGMCGLYFQKIYFFGMKSKRLTSKEMRLGQWFEYKAFGGLPVYGDKPKPDYYVQGPNKGFVTDEFERAEVQAENARELLEAHEFKVKHVSPEMIFENSVTHMDLICTDMKETIFRDRKEVANPDFLLEVIMDLKYTGLLEDKWKDIGWHLDSLPEKRKLMLQPTHYKWVYAAKKKRIPTFYFALFSSKADLDRKLIRVNIDPELISKHEDYVEKAYDEIMLAHEVTGFIPRPSVKNCTDCPVHRLYGCDFYLTVPLIIDIQVS